jgi:hypothetical protein
MGAMINFYLWKLKIKWLNLKWFVLWRVFEFFGLEKRLDEWWYKREIYDNKNS